MQAGSEVESCEAAWTEMTRVCGHLLGSLRAAWNRTPNGGWNFWTKPRSRLSGFVLSPNPSA